MIQDLHAKLNPGFSCQKQHSKRTIFQCKYWRRKLYCAIFGVYLFILLKFRYFARKSINTWKIMEYGVEERWKRQLGAI